MRNPFDNDQDLQEMAFIVNSILIKLGVIRGRLENDFQLINSYQKLESQLREFHQDDIQEFLNYDLADWINPIVFELTNGIGETGAGFLASKNNNLEVYVLCGRDKFSSAPKYLGMESFEWKNKVIFSGQDNLFSMMRGVDDRSIETIVNKLYMKNGISNVKFFKSKFGNMNLDENIPDYLDKPKKSKMIIGYNAPANYLYQLCNLYNNISAKKLVVPILGLNTMEPSEFPAKLIKKHLYFEEAVFNVNRVINSMVENHEYMENSEDEKEILGKTLKLAYAIVLANIVDGTIIKEKHRIAREKTAYSQTDFYVVAIR